jgi:hypothetical protein
MQPALKVQVQHPPWRICCTPKPYTHLSLEERALMQVWLEHGLSLRAIARKLKRAPSTITREFARSHSVSLRPVRHRRAVALPLPVATVVRSLKRAPSVSPRSPAWRARWSPVTPCGAVC